MARGLKFTKTVHSKGRIYVYFDTGQKDARGKPIYNRLPPVGTAQFGASYAAMLAGRTRRENVPGVLTLKELINLYMISPKYAGLAEGSKRLYARYLATLDHEIGGAPADEVEARDITKMMDLRGQTPGAANMILRVAGALYKWGRSRQHVTANPVKDIGLFDGGEHEPWPEGLLEAALAAEDANVRLAASLLYYTAQRLDDVRLMRWADIRGGVLYCRQGKTRKDLEIPVHRELAEVLAATKKTGLHIIAKSDGRPFSAQALRKWLQTFAADRGFKIVPHGLRKNAVNALLEAGCSAAETAAISGQSLSLVEHYAKRRNTAKLGKSAVLKWEAKA